MRGEYLQGGSILNIYTSEESAQNDARAWAKKYGFTMTHKDELWDNDGDWLSVQEWDAKE